jgi:hypothetical protein
LKWPPENEDPATSVDELKEEGRTRFLAGLTALGEDGSCATVFVFGSAKCDAGDDDHGTGALLEGCGGPRCGGGKDE